MELANLAEASGWEALLIWDHLGFVWDAPSCDPWVTLAAVAASTRKLMLGTGVTPLARYRPQRLAMTTSTLSRLRPGGFVLGVGLGGVPGEFSAFGESGELGERAARLDEGLEVLSGLWSGQEVNHRGRYYTVDGVTLAPRPAETIPVWVGGNATAAMKRAARWHGWFADSTDAIEMTLDPADFAKGVETVRAQRDRDGPMDYIVQGYSDGADRELVDGYRRAGATWWLEAIHDIRGSLPEMMDRVRAGPAAEPRDSLEL
jgi:alkanesulfonate monooxygenase SsuD/methylene tetrahydromethanopterin reductase-like flavin-dependent oxidoreductase (luciferase family)